MGQPDDDVMQAMPPMMMDEQQGAEVQGEDVMVEGVDQQMV
jgi:hypothetical protein